MSLVKKLAFAPFFLLSFAFFNNQLDTVLKIPNAIFSLDTGVLVQLLTLAGLILLTSLFFVIFVSLSTDWKIVIPVLIIAIFFPAIFFKPPINYAVAILSLLSLSICFWLLQHRLKTYLEYRPTALFAPSIKLLVGLLVFTCSIGYFFVSKQQIEQKGFQIPDSIIESALKFTPQPQNLNQTETASPVNMAKDLMKKTVNDQFQALLKPYLKYVPFVQAVLFYLTLSFFVSIFSIFLSPVVFIFYYILEKTGFLKFTTETRVVKKMVV